MGVAVYCYYSSWVLMCAVNATDGCCCVVLLHAADGCYCVLPLQLHDACLLCTVSAAVSGVGCCYCS